MVVITIALGVGNKLKLAAARIKSFCRIQHPTRQCTVLTLAPPVTAIE